jgi:hypothetical protein
MDDLNVVTQTLNSTLQRHARVAQGYEVEIANMTAEIIRLKDQVEQLESMVKVEKKSSKTES